MVKITFVLRNKANKKKKNVNQNDGEDPTSQHKASICPRSFKWEKTLT